MTNLSSLCPEYKLNILKIAVNARVLISHRMEGVARYIFETTRRMVNDHPEDEFHLYFDRPFDQKFIFAENVIPHVISPPARHPILWYIWFEIGLRKALKRDNIDILYSGDTFLSLKSAVPTIIVSHDINYNHYPQHIRWSHRKYYQKYFPQFHRKATHIIAVSETTKKDIVESYSLEEDKVTVAYNDVPEGFQAISESEKEMMRSKISSGKPFFIYLGSLHPRKNVEGLIKGFNYFKDKTGSDYKLLIYGRAAWKTSSIFETYQSSVYKDDIVFLDNSKISIHKALASAEALCYVSILEGFGIPILEAFESKVPVITSMVSSMPEVAEDAAILVDPFSDESIGLAMQRIIEEVDLKSELIEKGRLRKTKFSWQKSSEIIYHSIKEGLRLDN